MTIFKFLWLRRLLRRHTKPIPQYSAETWKSRLSLLYMILAWNAVGLVAVAAYNGRADWAKYHGLPQPEGSSAQQWSHTLKLNNVKVMKIAGGKVDQFEIHNEFDSKGNAIKTEIIREDENTNE